MSDELLREAHDAIVAMTEGEDAIKYYGLTLAISAYLESGGWVDVRERLPEEYVSVLIGRHDIPTFAGPIIAFRREDKWYTDTMKPALFATHWQPLPAAPKAKP